MTNTILYLVLPGGKTLRKAKKLFAKELNTLGSVRAGNKYSRIIHHILERINLKTILGGNIALAFVTTSLLVPTNPTFITNDAEINVLPAPQSPFTTSINVRYPLSKVVLNQGYYMYHRGFDLKGIVGEPIYPIMNGTVEVTEYSRFGYGNSIVIDHDNGIKSRYAHLSRIDVHQGDNIDTTQEIGLVGSTGHSTGPHLHLEIYKNDATVNPVTILGPLPDTRI